MTQPTDKTKLLAEIERAHQDMVRYLASLTDDEKTATILDEGWSIKDSLAHLVAWEKMTIHWLERSLQGEQVQRFIPGFVYTSPAEHEPVMLALNQHLYEQTRDQSLDGVMRDFRSAHRAIYDFVAQLDERDIFDPNRFPWREGSPALEMIAGNTYEHYDEHLGWIQASRARLPNYPENKQELLRRVRERHANMEALLATLTPAQMTATILDEGWSIKDSLSHLVAWEKLTVDWLERSLQGEYVRRFIPGFVYSSDADQESVMLAENRHLYEQTRERPLTDVMKDFRSAHRAIYDFVAQLDERDIFEPNRFAWREGSPALEMIAGNTYEHYDEHLGWIQASRARLPNYPENKSELLRRVRERHANMEALLATLTPAQMTAPELDAGWSVKDSLAHLVEWETLLMDWVGKYKRGEEVKRWAEGFLIGDGDSEAQMHKFNAHLYEKNRDLPLDQVLGAYRDTHARVVALLGGLSEDEIFEPNQFPARAGRPLITLIAGDSYEHYDEHLGWIRAWLAKTA